MPRLTLNYNVDLRCPCCSVHPVMKVHENTTVSVLFCSSCEHAWVMDSLNVPPREQRPARARGASVRTSKVLGRLAGRALPSLTERLNVVHFDAARFTARQDEDGDARRSAPGGLKRGAVHHMMATISGFFTGKQHSRHTWIRHLRRALR